jgi:transposase-like protein
VTSGSNTTLPDIDPIVKQRMSEFQKHIAVPFNIDEPSHYEELVRLWNIFFKDESFSLTSPLWKKLGFQSDSPLSDFRACGYFGLKNLLYFAEKYPGKFQLLADIHEKRSTEYYPFAIASFNVSMLICELLGWGWKRPGVSTAKDPHIYHKLISMLFPPTYSLDLCENVFSELYCLALVETDQEWHDSNATYMDFPVVISNSQIRLERHLQKFNGIEDLFQYNQTHLTS